MRSGCAGDVVGGDVIRLGAVPVGRLALNDREARGFKGGLRAVAAVLTGNRAGLALDDGDFTGAADLLDQVLGAEFADRHVVGGDISGAGAAQLGERVHIDLLVDVDDLDALGGRISNRVVQVHVGDRSHADRLIAGGDGVLEQGDLSLDVVLGVGGVDVDLDAHLVGLGLDAVAHGLPELAGENLQDNGVFRLALGGRGALGGSRVGARSLSRGLGRLGGGGPAGRQAQTVAIAKRIAMIFFIEFPPNMLSRPGRGGKCRKRVIVFSLHPKYNISPVECQPRGINFIDLMGNRLLILCKLPGLITKA